MKYFATTLSLIVCSLMIACQSGQRQIASQQAARINILVPQDFCLELVDRSGSVQKAYVSPKEAIRLKADVSQVRVGTVLQGQMNYLNYSVSSIRQGGSVAFDKKRNMWVLVRSTGVKNRYQSLKSSKGHVIKQGDQLERHPCNV